MNRFGCNSADRDPRSDPVMLVERPKSDACQMEIASRHAKGPLICDRACAGTHATADVSASARHASFLKLVVGPRIRPVNPTRMCRNLYIPHVSDSQ